MEFVVLAMKSIERRCSTFDKMARFVNIRIQTLRKTVSLLVAPVLLFAPLSVPPCPQARVSQDLCSCCCCQDSGRSLPKNDGEKNECCCRAGEKQQEESLPAVIVFQNDGKSEPPFMASEVEVITRDYHPQFCGLYLLPFLLTGKDPPLYLLHSSFLI